MQYNCTSCYDLIIIKTAKECHGNITMEEWGAQAHTHVHVALMGAAMPVVPIIYIACSSQPTAASKTGRVTIVAVASTT